MRPARSRNLGSLGLQRALSQLVDEDKLDRLVETLVEAGQWQSVRRLEDLRDPSVVHEWLWALNPAHGAYMAPDEYVTSVRIRLGADHIDEAITCAKCGEAVLGKDCYHALCCAPAESTIGHNKIRDAVFDLARAADGSAETEPEGLIPSHPALRPADVLTSAACEGGLAALDIGVGSPDAAGAGADCCEALVRRKMWDYGEHLEGLRAEGIQYRPLAFSCYGRLHPDAELTLDAMARKAARRRGLGSHRLVLRRAQVRIGVEIWRRAAKMVLTCLPQPSEAEAALLFGEDPAAEAPVDGPSPSALVSGLTPLAA